MLGKTNAQVKIGGVDTSDATATSNDILLGKTAYANDEKIVGTIPTYNNEHENGYVQTNTLKKLLDATKSTCYLFYKYSGTNIDGLIKYDDTENVTNMEYMFGYSKVQSISLLNTINVTNMRFMFYLSNIKSIPLLNTSKVTSMYSMFQGCDALTEVPALDVSNVTSFGNTFNGCRSLKAIHMIGAKKSFDISPSALQGGSFSIDALHEIINNLGTVTSTQTLTMGSANLANVSEEYVTIATNKGWTLA